MNDEAAALQADPARGFDGQYQLGAEIGSGALGVVYRGVDERLDKQVAIKVWHARFDDITPLREQYDAEARALTALEHPNVVAVTDYGIAGEAPYLVMELLEGETLEARMRASALPPSLTQTFTESLLRGLGYMHMRGVVHRNLKPDNVFLQRAEDGTETLKLLDMGLESMPANSNAAGAATVALSKRSAYDSPEQEAGSEPDGRSDVYAAGVMLVHMLSGSEPSCDELRAAADSAEGLARLLPHAIPAVRAFVGRAVATERSSRFGNADQMLRALLELPSPWTTLGDDAPAPTVQLKAAPVLSPPPAAESAQLEPPPTPALEPPPAAVDEEFEVGPIGLMARLRAHKRLLWLIGGGVFFTSTGAVAALLLERGTLSFAALSGAEQAAERGSGKPREGKVTAKGKTPEAAEEKEPGEEEGEEEEAAAEHAEPAKAEAAAAAKQAEPAKPGAAAAAKQAEPAKPGAEAAAKQAQPAQPSEPAAAIEAPAEPFKFSARLGDGVEEKKPAPETRGGFVLPEPDDAEPAQAAGPAKADEHAAASPEHTDKSGEHAATQPAAAAAEHSAEHAAPEPAGSAEHAAAGPAAQGSSTAPAKAAEPEAPKPPTPEQIGSERHIDPDSNEIRQMLALAVAPKARVAAKDPWDISLPDSLQALRDAIERGARGSATNIKTLRRYNTANPDDVYGHLLLAGFYANRGYSLDALDQYDMAYRIDPSSRGAPEMLKHPLDMVSRGIAERDAVRFIDRVYGREAQSAIAQRLRSRDTSAAAAARLKKLQSRLGAKRR